MFAGSIGLETESPGARTLGLLATPLTAAILDELALGARRLADLRRGIGSPPQTTLRARLKELSDVGVVAKRRLHPFPSVREHVLTNGAGTELRFVALTLEGWLGGAPDGGLELGGEPARAAVKAFAEGWSAGVLRFVAERPTTLSELDMALDGLSRHSLERRLLALVETGLVDLGGGEREPSYRATDWLRRAAAPLVTAIRWERKHRAAIAPPVGPAEAEAGLLLALPLLRLPEEISGRCRLGVELESGDERRLAGVTVQVEGGRIVSCRPRLELETDASASGPPPVWQRVAIEARPERLELDGDTRLARAVLDGLNRTLFPPRLI